MPISRARDDFDVHGVRAVERRGEQQATVSLHIDVE